MTENSRENFTLDPEQEQILDNLTALILANEQRTSVLNLAKLAKIEAAYALLRALTRDMEGVRLTYALHEPFKSTGFISLEGESLEFYHLPLFSRAAGLANNIEIYPLIGDRVRMTFTFLGLTVPIE